MDQPPGQLEQCPNCLALCQPYVTSCPFCGSNFGGPIGREGLDEGGFLERAGLASAYGFMSGVASIIVGGILGLFDMSDSEVPVILVVLAGVLAPVLVLGASWLRLGMPKNVSPLRASDHIFNPAYAGLAAPPAVSVAQFMLT